MDSSHEISDVKIISAEFISSAVSAERCPPGDLPEYAFVGRSNVGKSSLINMLLHKKGLAKTSGTPGKTQTINHYRVYTPEGDWHLVDLPGYGYARTARTSRERWERFVRNYLLHREQLRCTFVLVDVRHEPQASDLSFMEWMGKKSLPFAIVFTKCDKLTPGQIEQRFAGYRNELLKTWSEMPSYFLTSADTRLGREGVLNFIGEINAMA